MARITVEDCLDKVDNRFELVMVSSKRARQLQIEGKVVDTQSGEVVAEFAERRRSSGSLGAQDLKGDAGPHIIEHLVSLVSEDVDSELRASFRAR